MPMIIRDRENGLLIEDDDDPGELVERILQVADDPEFALALSEQGRLAWAERLSWQSWADRFIELVTPLVLARQP